MTYLISKTKRDKYISLVLLNEIIQFQHYFPTSLSGNDSYLGPYLHLMHTKGLLEVEDDRYIPTVLGREELENLYVKYLEYLKIYDIFCAVDLEAGEFAFSSINEDFSDDEWNSFLSDERFSDVRVAVADFKGLDPTEIVFMSFINEGRFEVSENNWQSKLVNDSTWIEIEEICNTAVSRKYLEADGVLEDVIKKGSQIALELIRQEEEETNEETVEVTEIITEEIIEETTDDYVDVVEMPYYGYSYWDPYYDPYYVSPIWIAAAIVIW